ncbi:hypothetical protein EC973_005096 [Apophysomyces ossiformis]|uniref:Uncharacterized protein n=1 Tax=Apophysomyces ossiformis TaxID=679940 RepID=A0A8H7EM58_9FUNG|nr:hypothetical protein EC973_005096 [Apophysomyces ossiformis]
MIGKPPNEGGLFFGGFKNSSKNRVLRLSFVPAMTPKMDHAGPLCPQCSSEIKEYLLHFDSKFSMCENVKCSYPFDQSTIDSFIEPIPNASRARRKRRTSLQVQTPTTVERKVITPSLPVDLHLPPTASARSFHNDSQVTCTTNYSLADIENLLSKEEDTMSYTPSTTCSAVTPPESNDNLVWLEGLDDVLNNIGTVDFKLDPLQSESGELDSLLGFH